MRRYVAVAAISIVAASTSGAAYGMPPKPASQTVHCGYTVIREASVFSFVQTYPDPEGYSKNEGDGVTSPLACGTVSGTNTIWGPYTRVNSRYPHRYYMYLRDLGDPISH